MKCVVLAMVAAVLAAAAYAEFVLDIRAPRSALVEGHFIQTAGLPDFERVDKAMKAKYGPNAVTNVDLWPPRWVTTLDGKVVHEEQISRTFKVVRVQFEIGASGQQTVSRFMIRFEVPSPPDHSSAMVRRRYGPNEFDVNGKPIDYYVGEGPCVVLAASDLGSVGAAVRFKSGTFCVVECTGSRRASMLIGAPLTDGDPWMRPFSRRICRSLAALALRKLTADRSQAVQYAGCVMIDRGVRAGYVDNSEAYVYEVLRTGELALIVPRSPLGL